MVLAMSRPFKHPKTGVYYFRKAVPNDLRPVVGKREEKISLRTKDPAAAKIAYSQIAAEVENRWKALRATPEPLTHKQVVALAGEAYSGLLEDLTDEPGDSDTWSHVLRLQSQAEAAGGIEAWTGPLVDDLLLKRGLCTDDASRTRLIQETHKAITQAAGQLKRNAEGDYRADPEANRFPEWQDTADQARPPSPSNQGGWTLTGLLEDWWREAKASGIKISTYENYSHTVNTFVEFLEHDSLRQVAPEDVVAFKDFRLAQINPRTGNPISPKTVKDNDLSGLRSLFNWAKANRRIEANPADGITIKLGKKIRVRSKGFTEEESTALLTAALTYQSKREKPKRIAGKRWTPWLCAYTGSRIGEMVQLRKEDLKNENGIWVLTITPEAGTVKNGEMRRAPLHPHLEELGFPEFVASCGPGYLFMTPDEDGEVRGPWRTAKNRITEFVRTVITDPNVSPNHGWRHLFKTIGMEADISHRVLDAIQGHAPRTAGEDYGEVTIKAQAEALKRFPRFKTDC